MSESLADVIARRRKEKNGEIANDISVEVSALPPPPSSAPQPQHLRMEDVPRYSPRDSVAFKDFLEEHGFVVISGVLDEAEVATAVDLLWNFVEKSGMTKNDPASWKDENFRKIASLESGIIARGGIGQSDFQWYCRTRPSVIEVFSCVYDTRDLLTSLDGGNIFRPWQAKDILHQCTSGGWMHVDQGRLLRGMQCIQGLVTLTDVNEETGGFCCIPRSHLSHDSLMNNHATSDDNFVKIPSNSPTLLEPQILPRCKAGDMILWDSRTIHCSSPALVRPTALPDRLLRMASYICMVPTSTADDGVIEKRVEMYQYNVTGTHWPHKLKFKKSSADQIKNDMDSLSSEAISLLIGDAAASRREYS